MKRYGFANLGGVVHYRTNPSAEDSYKGSVCGRYISVWHSKNELFSGPWQPRFLRGIRLPLRLCGSCTQHMLESDIDEAKADIEELEVVRNER